MISTLYNTLDFIINVKTSFFDWFQKQRYDIFKLIKEISTLWQIIAHSNGRVFPKPWNFGRYLLLFRQPTNWTFSKLPRSSVWCSCTYSENSHDLPFVVSHRAGHQDHWWKVVAPILHFAFWCASVTSSDVEGPFCMVCVEALYHVDMIK